MEEDRVSSSNGKGSWIDFYIVAARELADWVVLAHLKDIRLAGGDEPGHVFAGPAGRMLTGAVIGEGVVDLPGVRAVMYDAGYAGWWSLEFEGAEEPLSAGVPQSLAAARALLR